MTNAAKPTRCAIYTRKSSEEGLEQEFNSLDAQREACEAYIKSQKHEGWQVVPEKYDDGGFSGGTLVRPALNRLLADVQDKKIDVIIVYKIDRLTRSLFDFSKIVEIFEVGGASFVSVTQQFNTTTSMGRLTLNVLLSFAQFEREVTGERIRDKIAASKKKGMWMGGFVPLGYEVINRELVIKEDEAQVVRQLFDLYIELSTVNAVKAKADALGLTTRPADNKEAGPFDRGYIHRILTNPIYIGKIPHKKLIHEGLHKAIIGLEKWNKVQLMLQDSVGRERDQPSATGPSPLAGKLFESSGERLTPSHAVKGGKRYRYYISYSLIRDGKNPSGVRISAPEVEGAVCNIIREFITNEQNTANLIASENPNPSELRAFIGQAKECSGKLVKLSTYAQLIKLKTVIEKISISPSDMSLTLKVSILLDLIRGKPLRSSSIVNADEPMKLYTTTTPMRLGRRGRETRLILNNSSTAQRPVDQSLLSCIARGYAWRHEIVGGKSKSSVEIARRENVTPSFVSRLIDASFLAPDILEAIADGRSPVDLTANKLLYSINIPLDWPSQRYVLGFNS
jgi:DNA invertase Pin-like site-specific DNA recombinase